MESLNFSSLLAYGAIGLGCILAVLAYFLLRKEQDQPKPRKQVLTSVYVFMAFSLTLTCLGFGAELWKDSASRDSKTTSAKVTELKGEIEKRNKSLTELQQKHVQSAQKLAQVEQQLKNTRQIVKVLMDQKAGKVSRLGVLTPSNPSYAALVAEIQADLARIDTAIADAIKESS
jgi:TolA-binding protein